MTPVNSSFQALGRLEELSRFPPCHALDFKHKYW